MAIFHFCLPSPVRAAMYPCGESLSCVGKRRNVHRSLFSTLQDDDLLPSPSAADSFLFGDLVHAGIDPDRLGGIHGVVHSTYGNVAGYVDISQWESLQVSPGFTHMI